MVLCDFVKGILGIDNLLTNDEIQLNFVCSTLKYSIPRWKRGLCSQFVDSGASCFANTGCSCTALCRKVIVPVQNQMDFSTAEMVCNPGLEGFNKGKYSSLSRPVDCP